MNLFTIKNKDKLFQKLPPLLSIQAPLPCLNPQETT